MLQAFKKGKDVSVMVWAAIYGDGKRAKLIVMGRDFGAKIGLFGGLIYPHTRLRPSPNQYGGSHLHAGQRNKPQSPQNNALVPNTRH